MNEPGTVLAVGDVHRNLPWMLQVVYRVPELLAGEDTKVILQLGDFMAWENDEFLATVHGALEAVDATLVWVDGNHEDHDQIASWPRPGPDSPASPVVGGECLTRIRHLPRGFRWRWHDRTWLALGGAVSVDQGSRVAGRSWWPQEAITGDQAAAVAAAGRADVMVTHDCPSRVALALPPPPRSWLPYVSQAQDHRALLQDVVDQVQPSYLLHGHYHRLYSEPVGMPYGTCQVTGLGSDGSDDNYRVLDVRTMEWSDNGEG
jgi:hypothetical protein